ATPHGAMPRALTSRVGAQAADSSTCARSLAISRRCSIAWPIDIAAASRRPTSTEDNRSGPATHRFTRAGARATLASMTAQADFVPLRLCVLTVSDSRTPENDTSGDYLVLSLGQAGHQLHERRIVKDNRYVIRAIVAQWIADESIHGVLVTGGTGFTGPDSAPHALLPRAAQERPGV